MPKRWDELTKEEQSLFQEQVCRASNRGKANVSETSAFDDCMSKLSDSVSAAEAAELTIAQPFPERVCVQLWSILAPTMEKHIKSALNKGNIAQAVWAVATEVPDEKIDPGRLSIRTLTNFFAKSVDSFPSSDSSPPTDSSPSKVYSPASGD